MKRSVQLESLSWEHHDALVVARNIRKGLESGADPQAIAEYVDFICREFLEPHFRLEERALLERMSAEQREDWSVRQVLQEHEQFRQLCRSMQQETDSRVQQLTDFVALLKTHVNLEEHWFFPYCESILGDAELDQAAAEINSGHRRMDEKWPNRFWESQD